MLEIFIKLFCTKKYYEKYLTSKQVKKHYKITKKINKRLYKLDNKKEAEKYNQAKKLGRD